MEHYSPGGLDKKCQQCTSPKFTNIERTKCIDKFQQLGFSNIILAGYSAGAWASLNLQSKYPSDWLLSLEILEISKKDKTFYNSILSKIKKNKHFEKMIKRSIKLY